MNRPKMLLHLCCAPCSTHVIELLRDEFDLTGLFYDPNIHPQGEYIRRLEEMRRYADEIGFPFIAARYDPERWFDLTKGWEWAPEGGERCTICYRMRMQEVARFAASNGFDCFTTVLSISPRKSAEKINQIGSLLAQEYGIKFYAADFKKRDGFKRSVELSKRHGLYRQDYCGCLYSLRDSKRLRALREVKERHGGKVL